MMMSSGDGLMMSPGDGVMMSSGDGVMMSPGDGVMMSSGDVDVYEDLVYLCVTLLIVVAGLPLVGMSEVVSANPHLPPSAYVQLCVVLLLSDLCVVLLLSDLCVVLLPVSSVGGALV